MTNIIALAKKAGFTALSAGILEDALERFAELIRADERSKYQSFSDKHPPNLSANCKCEHWQACKECHPTAFKGATT